MIQCLHERQDDGMNIHDWERFGEDIMRTIQDAVEYGNYDRLNQTITNTVNQAADWVNRNVGNADNFGNARRGFPRGNQEAYDYRRMVPSVYNKRASSKAGAILQIVFGSTFGLAFFIFAIVALIYAILAGYAIRGAIFGVIMLVPILGFTILGSKGISNLLRIQRFRSYMNVLGGAEFCNISELAKEVEKPVKYVVKDLEKMIRKKWFYQGHLDQQKTCLIVTDEMYERYLQLEQRKAAQDMEAQKVQRTKEESRQGLSPEVQKIIEQGDYYVKKIRECNDAIPGEEISKKISHMELVVDKIFNRIEQHPDSVDDIGKLMDYYLPTTIKLLTAYEQMDSQPVDGANIQAAKKEIEDTLDTLNVAFEKLLDGLFQEAAWDVSSDISVLHTMLAQEGLKDDGMRK